MSDLKGKETVPLQVRLLFHTADGFIPNIFVSPKSQISSAEVDSKGL
jgi:hypothetical protein